ncbi:glycoside hydrolase family 2 protein [Parabacteroides sp. 52]|uniref:beta-glucuronidase LacZ4 n=1 Tax=unclassified Parabacteroides TaxID=2649774 RepID=UPI0013D37DA6|nr:MULTISPECIES: glycoside hydrolase family 2 TIM barrel-domain containing protein [unclassified Parabacteroides]MDH6534402.1 beta-galactosidase [Parabacteroides sp. PM5-20]NDV54901.1 glycoside hydrolase family 2 protein [Parabacteroides sp. 52]
MKKTIIFSFLFLLSVSSLWASRKEVLLNNDWQFRFSWQVQKGSERRVDLPHTWNAQDALSGQQDYFRGIGNYRKKMEVPAEWEGKRLFLRFEGAFSVTNLFINQKHVGEHRGGYGAFVFDITDWVKYGEANELLVRVNNAPQLDIMPLVGDFNFYGGIYRDVNLVLVEPQHISLTDYASPGVYLVQEKVSREEAVVRTKVVVSNYAAATAGELQVEVYDGAKRVIHETKNIRLSGKDQQEELSFTLNKPHLWNGRKDPFTYRVKTTLSVEGTVVDVVEQPLGLRYYTVDADKGFFLNGEHLKLQGICRHQDRPEIGNALRPMHHEEDMDIILEMGTNAMRLAHYPQASYFYDLADRNGLVVWAEIPFIGPGGYEERGYVNQPSFRANGKEQLKELIRQHYNHPSICFWGLYNELKTLGDSPEEYINELNALAHQEDPTRPTVAASFLEDANTLNACSDMIAWNKYYGWYGGRFSDMGKWADGIHKKFPQYKLGISEYGAGASIYHQQEEVKAGSASGWWHPENWQTAYHIGNWQAIAERPFIWGSFIWNMFDFGAAHRTEGDRPGINDKGIVTFDRKVKKDAFYFYKANWNKEEPFVYIANRRCVNRTMAETTITVFTNQAEAELWVNGKSVGKQKADAYATITWENVSLAAGQNKIEVKAPLKKQFLTDVVEWYYK